MAASACALQVSERIKRGMDWGGGQTETLTAHHTRIRVVVVHELIATAMRHITIKLTALPEQRDLIDHAASLLGKNRSDFMLEASCERARAIALDQVFFSFDAEKFQRFAALLDTPQCPNPGLERLMAVKAPWTTTTKA